MHPQPILEVRDLRTYFVTRRGVGKAVDGVSFHIDSGETLGLVGESGSGKSVAAASIVGLHPKPAARIVGGEILFRGVDLASKSFGQLRAYRGRRIAMVFQDSMAALDPVFTVGQQLEASLRLHRGLSGQALRERAVELLLALRIPEPEIRLRQYPHQFSGGMRQRVASAIALSGEPEVLIADEPTTSLDVTIQAAYLELMREIQRTTGIAVLFITHDFGVVAKICDRVAVMYAGKIVETASTATLMSQPAHPYTRALLAAVPDVGLSTRRLPAIKGRPPSIYDRPPGCAFAPRCPLVMAVCTKDPPVVDLGDGHTAACWKLS